MHTAFFRKIADAAWFNNLILFVILGAAVLVGIETYVQDNLDWQSTLNVLDETILWIFTVEFVIKMLAEGRRPLDYFRDPWNVFDFAIVLVGWLALFLPAMNADFVAVIRLARVLRVVRLVNVLPELKLLINAMLKSIPSIGYVGFLLLILFYIYGAMGVFLFGKNDPVHFANLHTAMLSLFLLSMLDGLADTMYVNMFGCNHPVWGAPDNYDCSNPEGHGIIGLLYFISFVLFGTMIVLNLFIGVIMNSMDEVRAEHQIERRLERKQQGIHELEDEFHELHSQLDAIRSQLDLIAYSIKKSNGG